MPNQMMKIKQFESGTSVLTNILNASVRPSNISIKIASLSPTSTSYTITDSKKINGPTKINIDGVYFLEDEEFFTSGTSFQLTPAMKQHIQSDSFICVEYLVDNNLA